MELTVVICTLNRASILRDTLESFLSMDLPEEGSVELLIVDNNSADETPLIAKQFADTSSGRIRAVQERTPGLSHARNTGIAAARGDIIAFADDDVYFDRKWVKEILSAFTSDPGAHCAGGRSIPLFEHGEPEWMSPSLLTVYGSTNSGDEVKVMHYPEHPFGLNMAFRREVFGAVGTFNANLGRVGSSLLSNEESDLFYRISQAGLKVVYTLHAIVQHRIPKARTDKKYILRRNYWQGVSDVIFRQSHDPEPRRKLARNAIREIRDVVRVCAFMLRRRFFPRDGEKKPSFMEWAGFSYRMGTARQTLREAIWPTAPPGPSSP